MKNSLKMLLAAGALGSAGLFAAAPASAAPLHMSFRVGNVATGYNDGYYDRNRHFHAWRNTRERTWYRANYRQSFRNMRHDNDHDGIPNRFDNHPNNPYRR